MMKPTDCLHNTLWIARLAEGTVHSEELSKQYLDSVKKVYPNQWHPQQDKPRQAKR